MTELTSLCRIHTNSWPNIPWNKNNNNCCKRWSEPCRWQKKIDEGNMGISRGKILVPANRLRSYGKIHSNPAHTCIIHLLQAVIAELNFYESVLYLLYTTPQGNHFYASQKLLWNSEAWQKNCPQLIEISMNKYSIHQALILTALRK